MKRVYGAKRVLEPLAAAAAEAAAASAPAAAEAAAACPRLVRARTGFVDRHGPALEVLAVQRGDGLIGLVLVRHLDEAEPAGLAAELVLDDGRGGDVAEGREGLAQLAFVQVPIFS